MCGIAGFIGSGSKKDLEQMVRALHHRGPDAEGFFEKDSSKVFLGQARLSIIDLESGRQPMLTPDKSLVVVFNGEIYNHEELRNDLEKKGHVFVSHHSDTEVLLHGYREWGDRLPEKMNGMWAFVIYDEIKKELFASRDRFGKKPFFYSLQNNTFVFASELSTLILHPSVEYSISPRSLKKYFAYGYIPSPHSIYQKIEKLPAGCNLIYDLSAERLSVKKYWRFLIEPVDRIPENPEEMWGEKLRFLISKAVKRRMMSDVPLGVFLSGGIDSSSITAYAASFLEPGELKTFSISFDEKSFDESVYSSKVAEFIGTDHYNEKLSLERTKLILSEIILRLDEPIGDSSLLPTFLLSQITRKKVTVALGGDGADELFAGYDPFRALRLAKMYSKIVPKPVHKGIRMICNTLPVSHNNMSLDFKLKRTLRGLSYPEKIWNPVWLGPLAPDELMELFEEPVDIEDLYSEAIELWDECRTDNIVDQTLQFYTRFYLQDDILVKVDRASMMNSLEVRAPFLDIDLVNFVRTIPHTFKFRKGQTKYILKKALEPILPKEILYRSKKGFGIPIGQWLKEPFLKYSGVKMNRILSRRFISKAQEAHFMNRADNRAFLWNLWLLDTWY